MARLAPDKLLPLSYPDRMQAVLAAWGESKPLPPEPAIVPLDEGIWAWELFDEDGLGTLAHDLHTYVGMLASAYCDLVSDGVMAAGAPLNVCVTTRHPLWAACVAAQQEGLPLYTVIGEDDGTLQKVIAGGKLPTTWQELQQYLSDKPFAKALPDVLAGEAEPEEAWDAIAERLDETGYLMHPATARALAVARLYRVEAESRNPMLVAAPYHPYLAPDTLCKVLLEHPVGDHAKAWRQLELETGWEIPTCLDDTLLKTIQRMGETL